MTQRDFSGYGNNVNHPNWGRALVRLLRHPGLAGYAGDGHTPAGPDRPNARDISNIVCRQDCDPPPPNAAGLSDYTWVWGQFLDHELDLTDAAEPDEELDIPVKAGDPALPQGGKIPFKRSRFDPSTGGDPRRPREQINLVSSYIDGSNIYGENRERSSVLRLHAGGKLRSTQGGRLLPMNEFFLPNDHGPSRPNIDPTKFFVAGDIRCNEHVVLTCMHTLWMREHNRICDELAKSRKKLTDDDDLFFEARRRVIAQVQAITFEEFLPALLGKSAISAYAGYRPTVNATISNLFSTVCYRLGHSMVSPVIQRIPPGGSPTIEPLKLEEAFWNPALLVSTPDVIDQIFNGLAQQPMQQIDMRTVDALRNLLFKDQISGQADVLLDLAALNIQRGRDHGLPSYNACRVAIGLSPKGDIRDITGDAVTQGRLMMAYSNDVELIDPWVGGLAEDQVGDAQVGELFFHVIREQFERVRDGDRFWYEAPDAGFSPQEISQFRQTTLAQIIERNSRATIQGSAFRV